MTMQATIERIRRRNRDLHKLGLSAYLARRRMRFQNWGSNAKPIPLHPRAAEHPVYCRLGSSDHQVFDQIFVSEEYRCLADVQGRG